MKTHKSFFHNWARFSIGTALLAAALLTLATGTNAQPAASMHWKPSELIQPAALLKALAAPGTQRPVLIHVGFKFLYGQGHIPGSIEAGPASEPTGIASLKQIVSKIPHDRKIVLYCGCCPWVHCPNVVPAFTAMKKWGFTHVRVLALPENFDKDWIQQQYPTTKE